MPYRADKRGSSRKIRLHVRVLHASALSHVGVWSSGALHIRNILGKGSTNTGMKWFHYVTFLKFFVYLLHCFTSSMIEFFPLSPGKRERTVSVSVQAPWEVPCFLNQSYDKAQHERMCHRA